VVDVLPLPEPGYSTNWTNGGTPMPILLRTTLVIIPLLAGAWACPGQLRTGDPVWDRQGAGTYLDERERAWFAYRTADRGKGATKTSCVCCHTLLPYALARPALRKLTGTAAPTEYEQKLLHQTRLRVGLWNKLDDPAAQLLYDWDDLKKQQSRGTEAVLNAAILAADDRYQRRTAPSPATKEAFDHLWEVQRRADGDNKGSWEWLTFGLEPWESVGARYFGAALAAVAVGTAPGYYKAGTSTDLDAGVKLLRDYLRSQLPCQNLYNRAWALWASVALDGVLTPQGRQEIIAQLLAKQQADGGWSLGSLGDFARHDGTPEPTASDGYATGFVLHALQTAGLSRDDARIGRGIRWLVGHQMSTGEWRGVSVNKDRDPTTQIGKFMSDAATAYAVLALSH
jgi:squalene-hopene/tetraprenyl-beta-curcumene cyclase